MNLTNPQHAMCCEDERLSRGRVNEVNGAAKGGRDRNYEGVFLECHMKRKRSSHYQNTVAAAAARRTKRSIYITSQAKITKSQRRSSFVLHFHPRKSGNGERWVNCTFVPRKQERERERNHGSYLPNLHT